MLVKTIDLYCCTTTNDGDFFRASIVEQPNQADVPYS
jgi:hypothetical protein